MPVRVGAGIAEILNVLAQRASGILLKTGKKIQKNGDVHKFTTRTPLVVSTYLENKFILSAQDALTAPSRIESNTGVD